jgi:hypothetical protein
VSYTSTSTSGTVSHEALLVGGEDIDLGTAEANERELESCLG